MRRKFITNLLLLLFLNFLIKPFWVFGIDRTVQNVVGTSDYGLYFAIFNFAFILQIILDMGITNFNNRNIAQNNELLSKHFSGIILLRLVFAILYLSVIVFIGFLINYNMRQMNLLIMIGINQFLLTFILYLRSNISALLLFKTDSIVSVLDKLFMIVICSFLLWFPLSNFQFTIEWFVYAQTISYIFTAIIALLLVKSKTNYLKLNWNTAFFKMIIKKSAPYALLILLMGMYSRMDSFLIERLLPDGNLQAGIYASAFRLLDVANNMTGVLFAGLLLPIFAKMIKNNQELNQMVKLPLTILIFTSIIIAAITFFYSQQIVTLLYHQHPLETDLDYTSRIISTSKVLVLLMLAYVAMSITYVFGTLLTANGSLKILNIVALGGVVLSLSINFMLIPRIAAEGSAIALFSSQWATAIIQVLLAFKLLKLKIEPAFWLKVLIIALISFSLLALFKHLIENWYYAISLFIFAITLVAIALKFLNFKALLYILSHKE